MLLQLTKLFLFRRLHCKYFIIVLTVSTCVPLSLLYSVQSCVDTVNMHEKKYDTLDFVCLFIMLTLSIQDLQNIDLMVLMSTQSIQSNYNVNPNTK